MPVERTRRSGADANKLVWTTPTEPESVGSIAFTTNITPFSFCDSQLPPLVDPVDFEDAVSAPRRGGHSRKKPENHIPRPPNAFILFRSSFIKSQHVSTEVETNHSTLSKIIGITWKTLPEGERKVWHDKAKQALDDHKRKYPTYSFRPTSTKSKGGEKRKVREVGLKDMKRCAKIAELLVEGKKGRELDEAIQEFDKHHVPEVITRFEAPITERAFRQRRSSSVPAPESSQPEPSFLQAPVTPRKQRASNTRARHISMSPEAPALSPVSFEPFGSYSLGSNNNNMTNFDYGSFFDASSPQDSTFAFDAFSPSYALTPERVDSPLSINTSMPFDWSSSHMASPEVYSGPTSPITPALSPCNSMHFVDDMYVSTPFASSPASDVSSFNMSPFMEGATYEHQPNQLANLFSDCHSQTQHLSMTFPPMSSFGDLGMNMEDMGHVMPLDPNFSSFMASLPPFELST